ncbi:MAG TPA: protein-disulfide reductase DsbD family protein [Flavobacteriales bacterium]|nr:protein-disulfide reductase DsbD family protein [Flavobacteriales bacterium]HNU55474.1 protein-disulfide reductase DsbD family protein [Flavobacteriales bacterium]
MYPLLLSLSMALGPVDGPVSWSFLARPAIDGQVAVEITAQVDEGWHIYATRLENDLGPIPTSIRFDANEQWTPVGGLAEPVPEEVFDPNFEMQVRYHSGSPVFVQRFKPSTIGVHPLRGEVEFMVCNDKTCLPPEVVRFSIDVPAVEVKP